MSQIPTPNQSNTGHMPPPSARYRRPLRDNTQVPSDSLRKRYLYKVLASVFGLLSNLVIYSIVPRVLGPAAYGNFNFLSHFFSQLVEILDGRSSVGALVKASQRPDEKGLVVSYLYYTAVVSALLFGAIQLSHWTGVEDWLWPDQNSENIYLAAAWGLLVWYHGILHKLCDAYGYTVVAEKVRIFQKLLAIVLLLAFYYFDYITLRSFFIYYISTLLMLVVGFAFVLIRKQKFPFYKDFKALKFPAIRSYFKEYYIYTFPLLLYISLEAFTSIIDRWLLQYSSGAQEQGYFSLGFQISAISALFVSSVASLIEREFSIAHGRKDFAQLRYLFDRYIPLLFSFAAFFSCFTFFHAGNVIDVFAGDSFDSSLLVIVIMSAFPIFFTFGRILGSIYFATGQNILYRNLGFVFFLGGMVLSYILISPKTLGGLEMGAVGLSIKIVLVYGALVVTQFYFICKILKVRPWPYWLSQISVIGLFLLLSYLSSLSLAYLPFKSTFVQLLIGGLIYNLLVVGIVFAFPRLFGLTHNDITEALERVGLVSSQNWKTLDLKLPDLSEVTPKEKKKVMLLSARSSIHTVKWVNGLAELGHEVILVSMHDGGDPLHTSVQYIKLPWKAPTGYFLNIFQFKKLLAQYKPDLLHVHFVSGYGTLGTLSGFQPRMLSVWGTDIFNFPYLSQINKLLIYYNLKTASWICSTSWIMAKKTASVYKSAKDKMTVTPFGVDIESFKNLNYDRELDTINIGTIKTLMAKYGIDTLIQGFALAREELFETDPDLARKMRLTICGKGPQKEILQEMAESFEIGDITEFKGFVSHSEIPNELNKMDVYVAMSREESESFGVAIIEASSVELPVIVSSYGGLPEVVVHGETGFVVDENTPEALSERIIQLVQSRDLRRKMGQMGRHRVVTHYRWADNLKLMEKVYDHILGKPNEH